MPHTINKLHYQLHQALDVFSRYTPNEKRFILIDSSQNISLTSKIEQASSLNSIALWVSQLVLSIKDSHMPSDYPELGQFKLSLTKFKAQHAHQNLPPILNEVDQALDEVISEQALHLQHLEQKLKLERGSKIDATLFLHFHGDAFGKETGLEGSTPTDILSYLIPFLENSCLAQDPSLPYIKAVFNTAKNIDTTLNQFPLHRITKRTEALLLYLKHLISKGSPIGIFGGWVGTPHGHAVFYEILPQQNGQYTFCIYNTREGIDECSQSIEEDKARFTPLRKFINISKDKLLNEAVLQAIVEMKSCSSYDQDPIIYSHHHLNALIQLLGGTEEVNLNPAVSSYMTPQRSGTCSWKSLCAFIRNYVPIHIYKRFKHEIKLQSLFDFYNQMKQPIENPAQILLLKESLAKFARHVHKLSQDPSILSSEEVISLQSWIEILTKNNEESEKILSIKALKPISQEPLLEGLHTKNALFQDPRIDIEHEALHPRETTPYNFVDISESIESLKELKFLPETITSDLMSIEQEALHLLSQIKNPEFALVYINKALQILPSVNSPLWHPLDETSSTMIIQTIEGLLALQFKSSFLLAHTGSLQIEENVILALKGFVISAFLYKNSQGKVPGFRYENAEHRFNECVALQRFFPPHTGQSSCTLYFSSQNPELETLERELFHFARQHALYLEPSGLHGCLHLQDPILPKTMPPTPNYNYFTEFVLWTLIRTPWDDLVKKINPLATVIPDTITCNGVTLHQNDNEAIKLQKLYAMEDLLPRQYVAIRKTSLMLTYYMYGPIALPANFRSNLRDFEVTISYNQARFAAECSVAGIDDSLFEDYVHLPNPKSLRDPASKSFCILHKFQQQYRSITDVNLIKILDILNMPGNFNRKRMAFLFSIIHGVPEKYLEIAMIASEKDLQLTELLNFFSSQSQLLDEKDFQIFFECLFFERGNFSSELSHNPAFIIQLNEFLHKGINRALLLNNNSTLLFFLDLSRKCEEFTKYYHVEATDLPDLPRYLHLLLEKELDIEEKQTLFLLFLSICTQEDSPDLILGAKIFLKIHPPSKKVIDSHLIKSAQQNMLFLEKKLQENIQRENISSFMWKTLDNASFPHANSEWTISEFPFVTSASEQLTLNLLTAELLQENNKLMMLPEEISSHPLFMKLFNQTKPFATTTDGELFYFTYKNQKYRVAKNSAQAGQLIIEWSYGDRWLQHISKNHFLSDRGNILGSQILVGGNFEFWMTKGEEGVILAMNQQKHTPAYRLEFYTEQDGIHISSISSYKIDTSLHLADLSSFELGPLTQFEDREHIHLYEKEGVAHYLELPRFNLSFEIKENKFFSKEFPGFYLKPTTTVDMLDFCPHYLILENEQLEQILLLPKQSLRKPQSAHPALTQTVHFDQQVSSVNIPQQYCIYSINFDTNRLETRKNTNRFQLILVLLGMHKYKEAYSYLEEVGRPYTNEEERLLKEIIFLDKINSDYFPEAIALRLHAATHLLINNSSHHKESFNSEEKAQVLLAYKQYLNVRENIDESLFPLALEKKLIKFFSKIDSPLIQTRFAFFFEVNEPTTLLEEFVLSELDDFIDQRPTSSITYKQIVSNTTLAEKINVAIQRPQCPYITFPDGWLMQNLENIYKIFQDERSFPMAIKAKILFARVSLNEDVALLASLLVDLENVATQSAGLSLPNFPQLAVGDAHSENNKTQIQDFLRALAEVCKNQATKKVIKEPLIIKNKYIEEAHTNFMTPAEKEEFSSPNPLEDLGRSFLETSPEAHVIQDTTLSQVESILSVDVEGTDRPIQQEHKRLRNDLLALNENIRTHKSYHYSLKENVDIEEFKISLSTHILKSEEIARDQKIKLLLSANKSADTEEELSLHSLSLLGKKKNEITIDDLIIFAATQNAQYLQKNNPALSSQDLEVLMQEILLYLEQKTLIQQANKALRVLNQVENVALDDSLIQNAALHLFSKREYNIKEHPQYIVFEYFADILLRSDQVKKLETFIEQRDINPILQMIMGSGKSKVILPILGLMRANGNNLSIIIVPEPLFAATLENLKMSLQDATKQIVPLIFDRQTDCSEEYLSFLLLELDSVQKKRKSLLTTSKSIQCLYLKFIELHEELQKTYDHEKFKSLKYLKDILLFFKTRGDLIIDEADTLLNCRLEVNYSLGIPSPILQERSELVCTLYSYLYEPEIYDRFSIHCIPQSGKDIPPLTEETYHKELKPILVEKLLKQWNIEKSLQEPLKKYLLGEDCEYQASSMDADLIALAKEELNTLLPLTLLRINNENYGIQEGDDIAIPFKASNTPSLSSTFGNPYETINYTLQVYLENGISKKIIKDHIEDLKHSAILEMQRDKVSLEDTKGYQVYTQFWSARIDGPSFFSIEDEGIDRLQEYINENIKLKLQFIHTIILPKIATYPVRLKSTPESLVSLFKSVSGFTGTLWNASSFPRNVTSIPEEGIDAYTIAILTQNSFNKITISEKSTQDAPQELIDSFLKETRDINARALIDTGGLFKHFSNEAMARYLLNSELLQSRDPKIKGIVFFNENNELSSLEEKPQKDPTKKTKFHIVPLQSSSLNKEERFTFYDQSHTTGSDIPQAQEAIGIMTIGERTYLRDLLQSAWRMRGLDKNQQVHFYIPKDIDLSIRSFHNKSEGNITLEDILRYSIHTQAVQQGKDLVLSLRQKMMALIQDEALNFLLDPKHTYSYEDFKALQVLFLHHTEDHPAESYGHPTPLIPTKDALEIEKKRLYKMLDDLQIPFFQERAEVLKLEISQFALDRDDLPLHTPLSAVDNADCEVELQLEQEQEVEQEQQVETEQELVNSSSSTPHMDWNFGQTTFKDMTYSLFSIDMFTPNLFKKNLVFTTNILGLTGIFYKETTISNYACLIKAYDGTYQICLLTTQEASQLRSYLTNKRAQLLDDEKLCLLTLDGALVQQCEQEPSLGLEDLRSEEVKMLLVQAKFLAGQIDYSREEQKYLIQWLQEGHLKEKYELFVEQILPKYQKNLAAFKTSTLYKVFESLGVIILPATPPSPGDIEDF